MLPIFSSCIRRFLEKEEEKEEINGICRSIYVEVTGVKMNRLYFTQL
jgi:hypothetical protein